jgi:hypothetical protein
MRALSIECYGQPLFRQGLFYPPEICAEMNSSFMLPVATRISCTAPSPHAHFFFLAEAPLFAASDSTVPSQRQCTTRAKTGVGMSRTPLPYV